MAAALSFRPLVQQIGRSVEITRVPADRAKPAAGSVLVTKVMSKRNGEGHRSRQGQEAVGSDPVSENLSDDADGGESSTTSEVPSDGEGK